MYTFWWLGAAKMYTLWVSEIKWLRDNTSFRDDCVVLSGSSAERLEEARKAFAGRRGPVAATDRTLLQMGFRAFCVATGVDLPDLPTVHPRDILSREAQDAIQEARLYLHTLVPSWERYLDIGGFPRAVKDWAEERAVSDSFVRDLWDTVHGDALRSDWAATETEQLLELLSRRITLPLNIRGAARELSIDRDSLELRLSRLVRSYILWPCFQNRHDRPMLNAQRKHYFLDPLYARLASLRAQVAPPDYTELTEQQLGVTLLRAHEAESPGTLMDYDAVLFLVSPTRKEIDFTGAWLGGIPYEGKYIDGGWRQEAATVASAYGRGVLATRTVVDRDGDRIAVPAAILGLLLDPTPLDAAAPYH